MNVDSIVSLHIGEYYMRAPLWVMVDFLTKFLDEYQAQSSSHYGHVFIQLAPLPPQWYLFEAAYTPPGLAGKGRIGVYEAAMESSIEGILVCLHEFLTAHDRGMFLHTTEVRWDWRQYPPKIDIMNGATYSD